MHAQSLTPNLPPPPHAQKHTCFFPLYGTHIFKINYNDGTRPGRIFTHTDTHAGLWHTYMHDHPSPQPTPTPFPSSLSRSVAGLGGYTAAYTLHHTRSHSGDQQHAHLTPLPATHEAYFAAAAYSGEGAGVHALGGVSKKVVIALATVAAVGLGHIIFWFYRLNGALQR